LIADALSVQGSMPLSRATAPVIGAEFVSALELEPPDVFATLLQLLYYYAALAGVSSQMHACPETITLFLGEFVPLNTWTAPELVMVDTICQRFNIFGCHV